MAKLKGIRFKIIAISTTFTLVVTILIASVCFSAFRHLLLQSMTQSTKFNLQLIMNNFSSDMTPITTLSKWCNSNSQISKFLETACDHSDLIYYDENMYNEEMYHQTKTLSSTAWNRLREEFRNTRSNMYIKRIIVSNFNGNYIQISPNITYKTAHVADTIMEEPYFKDLYESESIKWIGLVPDPFSQEESQIIPIMSPIYAAYGSKAIGFSYILVSTDLLTSSLNNYNLPEDSKLYLTIGDKTYRINNNKFIEINPKYSMIDEEKSQEGSYSVVEVLDEDGEKNIMITVGSTLDGWYLTQTLSKTQFAQQKTMYYLIIGIISFVVIGLGFSLTFYLNRLINYPVKQINKKMKRIAQGDFSHDDTIEWDNELGEIGKGINVLSTDIVDLMDKRIESEKEKKELEYKMLQSQINPHFLYNTLNSIKWMATIQNATGIAEMTTALSRLMRFVSKDTQQIHTIREEITLLDNFFIIQKYRYGGTIFLEYNIKNDDLYQCQILKFTLQPIVENAIFHGIEPTGESGLISISMQPLEEDKVVIEITDNGIGMTTEQIEQTLSGSLNNKTEYFNKIGIDNIKQRIQYEFGADYGLTISSEPGKFTIVTIIIPYIRMES